MGKGFNNYMTKKFFHPSSKENIKRVWMAQQKTEFEKKKEDDMVAQYRKEQDMYENRALLGDEKAKLGLSFMYDAPPGLKKAEKEKEEGEPEYKFEWQRKFNAPREQYAKNDETIHDQPFGIEVRNVRCIKCRQWGHVNTDRICPLFGKDLAAEPPQPKTSATSLLESMREDGFTLKQSLLGKMSDPRADNEQLLPSDDEDDPEVKFLKSLSAKQKKKLLKKLNRLQQGQSGGKVDRKKKKKRKKEQKHKSDKRRKDSDSSGDSSDESEDGRRKRSKKKMKQSSGSSDSETDDERAKSMKNKHSSISKTASKRMESSSPEKGYRNGNADRHRGYDRDRQNNTDRHYNERSREKFDHGRGQIKDRRDESPPYGRNRDQRRDNANFGGRRRSRSRDRSRSRSRDRRSSDNRNRDVDKQRYRERSGSPDRARIYKGSNRSRQRGSESPDYRRRHRDSDEKDKSDRLKARHRRDESSSDSDQSDSSVDRKPRGHNTRRSESPKQRVAKREKHKRDTGRAADRRRSRSNERRRSVSTEIQSSRDKSKMHKKGRYERSPERKRQSSSDSGESSSD